MGCVPAGLGRSCGMGPAACWQTEAKRPEKTPQGDARPLVRSYNEGPGDGLLYRRWCATPRFVYCLWRFPS